MIKREKPTAGLILCLLLLGLSTATLSFENVSDGDAITIGEYRTVRSEILDEERILSVYTPYGYDEGSDSYPVLYLLGAQTDIRLMHAGSTMEYVDGHGKIPQMLVVVLDNVNGARDYLPEPRAGRPNTGQADQYLKHLVEEVIPFVDNNYRTIDYRVLCGFSTTAVFTVDVFLTANDAFNAYISSSAEIGWAEEYFMKEAKDFLSGNSELRSHLYMCYGSDDYQASIVDVMPKFVELFEEHAPDGLNWKAEMIEGGGHVPYMALHNGLVFVFPGWEFPQAELDLRGLEGLKSFYADLTDHYGFDVRVPTTKLMSLGWAHIRNQKIDEAIDAFSFMTEEYPYYADGYFWLGECNLRLDEKLTAREYFEKTLELDPSHLHAKRKLDETNWDE